MPSAGFLFDLDGTLLDSDPLHMAVFAGMLAPVGISVDKTFYIKHIHGRLNVDVFKELMPGKDAKALGDAKEAEFRRRLTSGTVATTPGLSALLDHAQTKAIPCAVVTNACRANAQAMLSAIGLTDRLPTVIVADDCTHGKPHPAPYLAGAAALGLPAHDCLAFEDSPSGLTAARAAGCTVFGLTSSLDPATLYTAGAHHAIPDFNDPALWHLLGTAKGVPV